MQVLLILYKSTLAMQRVHELFRERTAKYQQVPGLAQKLYVSDPKTGEVGGIYVFESEELLRDFVATGLEDIRETYRWSGPPSIRIFDVLEIVQNGSSSENRDSGSSAESPQPPTPGISPSSAVPAVDASTVQRPIEPRK